MIEVLIGSLFVMLIIATILDIKQLFIPDYISYTFIVIALFERLIYSLTINDWSMFLWIIPAVIISSGLTYLLYKAGMMGGGDVKIIASASIILAKFPNETVPMFIDYLINLFIAGALYLLPVSIIIGLTKIKPTRKESILMIASIITSAITLLFYNNPTTIMASIVLITASSLPFIKRIENKVMIREADMNNLMDGDWLINEVKVGREIIKPRKEGLTIDEANKIKKWWSEGKLKKKPLIKYGLPYLPAFLIALIITITIGNLLFILITNGDEVLIKLLQ